jgi:hypothetical protein
MLSLITTDRFWIDDRIYWTLWYSARLTLTSSLPLLASGFQGRTYPFFWVSELSPSSAISFSQRLNCSSLNNSPAHSLSLSLILRPTVSRPVCLGIKHLSEAFDQIFITVRLLRVCFYGMLSVTRGRVCRLQLFLVSPAQSFSCPSPVGFATIFYSQIPDFPFHRLLRLAGSRWRCSTPTTQGKEPIFTNSSCL